MTLTEVRSWFSDPTTAELQLIERYGKLPGDARRQRAFEAFARSGLPHKRMEQWKWTDVRGELKSVEKGFGSQPALISPPEDALVLRFNGREWEVPEDTQNGVRLFKKETSQALGNAESIPMAALAAALTGREDFTDTLQVEITRSLKSPVFLEFDCSDEEAAFSRIAFVIRSNASVDVIEQHRGGASLSSTIVEFGLQSGAQASRTLIQKGEPSEVAAVTCLVNLDQDARYQQTALAFGAGLARIETRLSYGGPDAWAALNAAYLPAPGFHVDFTTDVLHGAESCVTRQLTKGAVPNGGRGVFQGKFHVPRTIGQFTDADMQHKSLLLEDGAEVFAKPELEIYADDVECAHGNTSGQLDETALFYMRQRGIPLAEARALLTEAFISDALAPAHFGVREEMLEASRRFLRQRAQ